MNLTFGQVSLSTRKKKLVESKPKQRNMANWVKPLSLLVKLDQRQVSLLSEEC